MITEVSLDPAHLNRCVIGEDPGGAARRYLEDAYMAAHGEDISSLESGLVAANAKLGILHVELGKVSERYDDAPYELPHDKNDPRPMMPLAEKLTVAVEVAATLGIWVISLTLVQTQLVEKFVSLALSPAKAWLISATVCLAPAIGIKMLLSVWASKGVPAAKRTVSTVGASLLIGYVAMISHMVRPELSGSSHDSDMKALMEFSDAPAPHGHPADGDSDHEAVVAKTKEEKTTSSTGENWFLFLGVVGEMCVAACLMHNAGHRIQKYRPAVVKSHPVKVKAAEDRANLLKEIDTVSEVASDLYGRRSLHQHTCQLFVEENAGRVRAARNLFDDQRQLSGL